MSPQNKPKQRYSLVSIAENWLLPFILVFSLMISGLVNGCDKNPPGPPEPPGISASFIEEFKEVQTLTESSNWIRETKSGPSVISGSWNQGHDASADKFAMVYGFPAFSYTTTVDEYVYASIMHTSASSNTNVSGWLMTPVLNVKNGDKISFYTRADAASNCGDRLQVLMNSSSSKDVGNTFSSTGSFTKVLHDINSGNTTNGYPVIWTKYEHTFSGINGKINTRIAFRYYVPISVLAKGVGVDLFKFEVL